MKNCDRGLHYGDGLFETMAVYAGQVRLLARHMQRLRWGAQRLAISLPDEEALLAQIQQAAQLLGEGVLKLILSRGCGGRGYLPPEDAVAEWQLLPYAQALPRWDAHSSGIVARLCTLRLARQPALAGMKHLNRLEQVLARAEWRDAAIDEGIVLDSAGSLVECVASNLFLWRGQRLLTPKLDQCGVAGVMRAEVMQCAANLGYTVEELELTQDDLLVADEVFCTNAVQGIRPMRELRDLCVWNAWPQTQGLAATVWAGL